MPWGQLPREDQVRVLEVLEREAARLEQEADQLQVAAQRLGRPSLVERTELAANAFRSVIEVLNAIGGSTHVIDHVGVNVTDHARSKQFYEKALAPLGIELVMEFGSFAGFGRARKPEFWIGSGKMTFQSVEQVRVITPVHLCFTARSRVEVDAFHHAALAAGGRDHGAPGLRAEYHPSYYGAFVLDPDGHNVEAVCHAV
jgi:catechol 2,3-dioxygenase-like lactoylglutathione lyase family enzyme